MVGPPGKSRIQVPPQVLKGLAGQGEDEVHGHGLEGHGSQGPGQGGAIHRCPAQQVLKFGLEGLDADADPGHASGPEGLQHLRHHVVRVELHADTLGDVEVFLQLPHDLPQPPSSQSRGAAAKVQAGDPLSPSPALPHQTDLPE